ncbi:glycosyltransferase [Sedimentibacter saalensis]|uniref:glycosyltransferase n=1 Tax=Sedimentibacter saalensis TaxID=130788 RepID=UPI00289B4D29|nr:glycosyltransferase [Sedimentibacter saalensis]
MKLKDKIVIVHKAIKKVNKSNLIRKVYSVIKVDGIKALKDSIVNVARRDDLDGASIELNKIKNIYQEQQDLQKNFLNINTKKISVIILMPDSSYPIRDTLKSIEKQVYYNLDIVILAPKEIIENHEIEIDDSIKVICLQDNLKINDIINTIEGAYFFVIMAGNCLSPDAFYHFACEMEKGYAFAFSDECMWNFENDTIERCYFKPDLIKTKLINNIFTEQGVCFNTKEIIKSGGFENNVLDVSSLNNEGVIKLIKQGRPYFHISRVLLLRNYSFEKQAFEEHYIYNDFLNNSFIPESNSQKLRKVLLISHELTLTGAPIALHYAATSLLDNGDYPIIISPYDGSLRQTILDDGIPVIIDKNIFYDSVWLQYAKNFDLVIACTLASYKAIEYLQKTDIPTLWWAHEARESYENGNLKNTIPENVEDNIHVYCGGEYARRMLLSYRPKYTSELLLYAVPDFSKEDGNINYEVSGIDNKIVFSIIGTIMKRKGQDILAKAILAMPTKLVKKCKFIFVGKMFDAEVYIKVKELKKKYPDEVLLIDEVPRNVLMEIYKVCDSVICASRDDPMPIFMTEAMMLSKICICSENTGTASLIQDGINGFVYSNDDYNQLMEKIIYVVNNINNLENMKKKSRETYENNFTMNSFTQRLISTIDSIIQDEDKA